MQCNDGPLIFFLVCSHSYDECMQVFTIFFSRNVLPCLVVCERAALPVLQDLHYIIYWDSKEPTISKQILLLSVFSKTANCIHSRSCSFFLTFSTRMPTQKLQKGMSRTIAMFKNHHGIWPIGGIMVFWSALVLYAVEHNIIE